MKNCILLLLLTAALTFPAAAQAPADTLSTDSLTTHNSLTPRGEIVPIFKTANGQYYIIGLSRTGQKYRYYIKL